MKTIYLDQGNLLRAINTVSRAGGIIEITNPNNSLITICEVDDKGLEALKEEKVPFSGGDEVKKKDAPEKKKKLTSSTK